MAYPYSGKAVFSTRNGQYLPRQAIPGMHIILRSSAEDDRDGMVATLLRDFPTEFRAIASPITNIYDYFDHYDAQLQGFEFLRSVLEHIAGVNAVRARQVQDYVSRWRATNTEAFVAVVTEHGLEDLFTKEDMEEYAHDFLEDAMVQIKHLKVQEHHKEDRERTSRLQLQHSQMVQAQQRLAPPQAPIYVPLPCIPPEIQSLRVVSDPEQHRVHAVQGPLRQFPPPLGQFSSQQGCYPMQRLTLSTVALEHAIPGTTSRGDFHSDPAAHLQDTYARFPDEFNAVPSQGIPGPFRYQTLPSSIQSIPQNVPLSARPRSFHGNQPRGKKNPVKKSSDDARREPNMMNSQHQPSGGGYSAKVGAPRPIYFPQTVQSPNAMKQPSLLLHTPGSGHRQDRQNRGDVPRDYSSGVESGRSYTLSSYGSGLLPQVISESSSLMRNVINRSDLGIKETSESVYDSALIAPNAPASQNWQYRHNCREGQFTKENVAIPSLQPQPSNAESVDSNAFRHQTIPNQHIALQNHYGQTSDVQKSALAPRSNEGSLHSHDYVEQRGQQTGPGKPVENGYRLWIGGFPDEVTDVTVWKLLQVCRGLRYISQPRRIVRHQGKVGAFVVADFQNLSDAEEAKHLLPQTRFDILQGRYLKTNYSCQRSSQHPMQKPSSHCHFVSNGIAEKFDQVAREAAPSESPSKQARNKKPSDLYSPSNPQNAAHGRNRSSIPGLGKESRSTNGECEAGTRPQRAPQMVSENENSKVGKKGMDAKLEPLSKYEQIAEVEQHTQTNLTNRVSGLVGEEVTEPRRHTRSEETWQISSATGDTCGDDKVRMAEHISKEKSDIRRTAQPTSSRQNDSLTMLPRATSKLKKKKNSWKKSKGSNRLSAPERKDQDLSAASSIHEEVQPIPEAKRSSNAPSNKGESSVHQKDEKKQDVLKTDATKPRNIWEIQPDIETTADNPVSVAAINVIGHDGAGTASNPPSSAFASPLPNSATHGSKKTLNSVSTGLETTTEVILLNRTQELTSEAIIRETYSSMFETGSSDHYLSVCTARSSFSHTERSNGITGEAQAPMAKEDPLYSKKNVLALGVDPGQLRKKLQANVAASCADAPRKDSILSETFPEAEQSSSETPAIATSSEEVVGDQAIDMLLHDIASGTLNNDTAAKHGSESVGSSQTNTESKKRTVKLRSDGQEITTVVTESPKLQPTISDRGLSRSSERKRGLEFRDRLTSLLVISTPVMTHKKKQRQCPRQSPSHRSYCNTPIQLPKRTASHKAVSDLGSIDLANLTQAPAYPQENAQPNESFVNLKIAVPYQETRKAEILAKTILPSDFASNITSAPAQDEMKPKQELGEKPAIEQSGMLQEVSGLSNDSTVRVPIPDSSRYIPKPETPFLVDGKESLPDLRINPNGQLGREDHHPVVFSCVGDYYMLRNEYQMSRLSTAMSRDVVFKLFNLSDAKLAEFSTTIARAKCRYEEQRDLEFALRDAEYPNLSSSRQPPAATRDLDRLEKLFISKESARRCTDEDKETLYIIGKGSKVIHRLKPDRVNPDEIEKQRGTMEMIKIIEDAQAARRLQAGSPLRSQAKKISETLLENQVGEVDAQKMLDIGPGKRNLPAASSLKVQAEQSRDKLNTSPRRKSSKTDSEEQSKWDRLALQYVKRADINDSIRGRDVQPHTPTREPRGNTKNSKPISSGAQGIYQDLDACVNVRNSYTDSEELSSSDKRAESFAARSHEWNSFGNSSLLDSRVSKTFAMRLDKDDDPMQILADWNASKSLRETPRSESSPFTNSIGLHSSESEEITTPLSPNTLGRRTPSEERATPPPPFLPFANTLPANTFDDVGRLKAVMNVIGGALNEKGGMVDSQGPEILQGVAETQRQMNEQDLEAAGVLSALVTSEKKKPRKQDEKQGERSQEKESGNPDGEEHKEQTLEAAGVLSTLAKGEIENLQAQDEKQDENNKGKEKENQDANGYEERNHKPEGAMDEREHAIDNQPGDRLEEQLKHETKEKQEKKHEAGQGLKQDEITIQSQTVQSGNVADTKSIGMEDEKPLEAKEKVERTSTKQGRGDKEKDKGEESGYDSGTEGNQEGGYRTRSRGGWSPSKASKKRDGKSGTQSLGKAMGKTGGKNGGNKDPWALPEGEVPWGKEKKRRGG